MSYLGIGGVALAQGSLGFSSLLGTVARKFQDMSPCLGIGRMTMQAG